MENKLMMKLLIGSEAVFFLSLIMGYIFFWRSGNFPAVVKTMLDIKSTGLFTFLLISSSFTFYMAERNFQKQQHKKLKLWLLATIILGTVFLIGQGREYYHLIQSNVTVSKSEFGSSFYTLTGFHGLHVFVGLIILTILLILVWLGYFKTNQSSVISTAGMYWHFVDAVWIVVFTIIYVLPHVL